LVWPKAKNLSERASPRTLETEESRFQRDRFAGINPALMAVSREEKPETGRHFWETTKGGSKDSGLAVCLPWLIAFTSRPLSCQVGAAEADQADKLREAAKDIRRLNPLGRPH